MGKWGENSEAVKGHSVGVAACTTTEETQQTATNINVNAKEKPEKCLANNKNCRRWWKIWYSAWLFGHFF